MRLGGPHAQSEYTDSSTKRYRSSMLSVRQGEPLPSRALVPGWNTSNFLERTILMLGDNWLDLSDQLGHLREKILVCFKAIGTGDREHNSI
jgi:hypothetical protein